MKQFLIILSLIFLTNCTNQENLKPKVKINAKEVKELKFTTYLDKKHKRICFDKKEFKRFIKNFKVLKDNYNTLIKSCN